MASCIPHPHLTSSRVRKFKIWSGAYLNDTRLFFKVLFQVFLDLLYADPCARLFIFFHSDDPSLLMTWYLIGVSLWSERTQLLDTDPCLIHLVLRTPGWVRHRSGSHWASIAVGAVGLRSTWQVLNGYDIRSLLKRKVECHLGW